MTYRVHVTATAKAEADAAYGWLAERMSRAADWFNGLVDAVESLAEMPARCGLARENRHFDEDVRQLLYGKRPHVYRILFVIRGDVVYVLHVRHAARKALGRGGVIFPDDQAAG